LGEVSKIVLRLVKKKALGKKTSLLYRSADKKIGEPSPKKGEKTVALEHGRGGPGWLLSSVKGGRMAWGIDRENRRWPLADNQGASENLPGFVPTFYRPRIYKGYLPKQRSGTSPAGQTPLRWRQRKIWAATAWRCENADEGVYGKLT